MAFTLADYDARLIDRCGTASTDTRLTSTARYRAINDALAQVCLEHDWQWLLTSATLTTVAGTATYATPTRHLRTDDIFEPSTGSVLVRRTQIEVDQVIATGRPSIYRVDGALVHLRAIPDGVYTFTHRYRQYEPTLVQTTDAPLIPDVYSRGVVEHAAKLCLSQVREYERAAEAAADYNAWLSRVKDNINQSREPARVRIRPGSWF